MVAIQPRSPSPRARSRLHAFPFYGWVWTPGRCVAVYHEPGLRLFERCHNGGLIYIHQILFFFALSHRLFAKRCCHLLAHILLVAGERRLSSAVTHGFAKILIFDVIGTIDVTVRQQN